MELTHRLAHRSIYLTSAFFLTYFMTTFSAMAQIVPDATLPVNSTVTTTGQLHTINGGTARGVNLYHSFQDFSVPINNTAYFNNAPQVQNILTRVTGSSASDIDGTIRANGNANLYLLNPNGITFGQNAKLEIGGSFTGSTGSSFKFPDGSEFSAKNPQAPPLLTMSITPGLQYGQSQPGATITSRGNLSTGLDLVLNADKLDLQGTLVAGRDLTLQAQDAVKIRDTVANPFVATSSRDMLIQGSQGIDILALNHPQWIPFVSGGNLTLASDGVISADAHFSSVGEFKIRSLSGKLANFISLYDPIISSSGNVDIASSYTGSSLLIESKGNVQIQGTVTISTPDMVSSFVGNDTVLSTQPGLVIRSGQNTLVYGATNQNNPLAFTNSANIPVGITLAGAVRVQPNTLGGIVRLTADQGGITFHSIDASSTTDGNGGSIELTAQSDITNTDGFLDPLTTISVALGSFSYSTIGDAGNGGNISLTSTSGNIILNYAAVESYSRSPIGNSGNGGAISIYTGSGNIPLDNFSYWFSYSWSDSGDSGDGGAISFASNSGNISLKNNSNLTSYSRSFDGNSKNGGAISISSNSGNISLNDSILTSLSLSSVGNSKNGGAISISSNSGNISLNSSQLTSSSNSESSFGNSGNGGAIFISSNSGNISLDKGFLDSSSFLYSYFDNSGNGGVISVSSGSGNISLNNSQLISSLYSNSSNSGNAGAIFISAPNGSITASLASSLSSIAASQNGLVGSGTSGKIMLEAKNQISNLTIYTASTFGQSGEVKINGTGDLAITNLHIIASKNISITSPFGPINIVFGTSGQSGNVAIVGLGSLTFDNSIINNVTQGSDPAGNISITSPSTITFQNNTQILSSTNSIGNAGNVTVTAGQAITFKDNSKILAQTISSGKAGNIDVRAGNSILFSGAGTGLFADTTLNSTGNGGDIFVDPQLVTLQNGAKISVSSLGSGIGGNIFIFADRLILSNGSFITAETASTNGGNITLNIPAYLLLRFGSQISTTAGTALAGGNGGNININAGFIIGVKGENSDIFANAFKGNGGNVNISTNGIYGLEFRPLLTSFSDITASSQFGLQGNVLITTPGLDPSRGLTSLPVNLTDPSKQVSQSCAIGGKLANRDNRFTVSGRGGLPKSPTDELSSIRPLVELADLVPSSTNSISATEQKQEVTQGVPKHIVEANTLVRDSQGILRLVAASNPLSPAIPQLSCPQQ
ncbi:Filamentous hemagglutinin family outer membrane protein [Tumidithrix helvetica PCC 7403]|uniref:two-partner secretion domain-containing protein n=1 Tax=Tumidithrix helvetica TaxID=3457545 RepID=UPI003C8B8A1F